MLPKRDYSFLNNVMGPKILDVLVLSVKGGHYLLVC